MPPDDVIKIGTHSLNLAQAEQLARMQYQDGIWDERRLLAENLLQACKMLREVNKPGLKMNLIDALKQSRPIGRRSWRGQARWEWYDPMTLLDIFERGDLRPWSRDDLLADDWEIKDQPI